MVAAKAGRTMVGAVRAAAASAAEPETKRRLCKISSLARAPLGREGVGVYRTINRYGKCGGFASAAGARAGRRRPMPALHDLVDPPAIDPQCRPRGAGSPLATEVDPAGRHLL